MAKPPRMDCPYLKLTVEIPAFIRDQFRAACAMNGKEMAPVLRAFIYAYLDGNKKILDGLKEQFLEVKDGE